MKTTNETKHTPGPWRIHHKHRRFRRLILAGPDTPKDGIVICEVLDGDVRLAGEVAQANAALIASAPDLLKQRDELLEALKAVYSQLRRYGSAQGTDECQQHWDEETDSACTLAKAALASATGKGDK